MAVSRMHPVRCCTKLFWQPATAAVAEEGDYALLMSLDETARYAWGWVRTSNGFGLHVAWDCFGFRLFHDLIEPDVEVLLKWRPPREGPVLQLTWGTITDCQPGKRRSMSVWVTLYEVRTPFCLEGMTIMASLRAVKHWVRKFKGALQRLRWANATMVLLQRLPSAPEIVHHVQSFS